jgi:hypothetical protein
MELATYDIQQALSAISERDHPGRVPVMSCGPLAGVADLKRGRGGAEFVGSDQYVGDGEGPFGRRYGIAS